MESQKLPKTGITDEMFKLFSQYLARLGKNRRFSDSSPDAPHKAEISDTSEPERVGAKGIADNPHWGYWPIAAQHCAHILPTLFGKHKE